MLTRILKKEQISLGKDLIKKNRNVVFTDFSEISSETLRKFKIDLRESGTTFKVIKKRLFAIALKEAGIEFDVTQFPAQSGLIFVPGELSDAAGIIYKFVVEMQKEKKVFTVLGAYDIEENKFLSPEEFTTIAKLPSRNVLLGMVLGAVTGPLRAFMYVLTERAKQVEATS